jgi:putative glutamine amidotransferase
MGMDDYGMIRQGIDYSYIRREYGQEVRAAGGQPIFLDSSIDPEFAASLCDGIVISGGQDIDPGFYGQEKIHVQLTEPSARTKWERSLIEACDNQGVSILGVCYGMQLLNVHYGGTLYQDITAQQGTTTDHGASSGSALQRVRFANDFLSFQKGDNVETAHRHHQAVRQLGNGFSVVATAEDGIVEAIAGNGHYGVQWHAESDGTASNIYGAFIALCVGGEDGEFVLNPLPEAA